jgi:RNA polymerase sigma factor (sigma-70 family)
MLMKLITKNTKSYKCNSDDFETLIRPHLECLYRISYRYTGNKSDAEDLVQNLLVKLYPRRDELFEVINLRSWLLRVLYRQFIDSTRKQKRTPLKLITARHPIKNEDPLEKVPSPNYNPEEYTQRKDLAESIKQALDTLNKDQRAVIVMHDIEGYKLNELEILLEVPQGTLKSRLHRGRAKIRDVLIKNGTF